MKADWRRQLLKNERRTWYVIALFITMYLGVGFLVDVYWQLWPVATWVTGSIACLAVGITLVWHDRIMLLGTKAHEVTLNDVQERQLYNLVAELQVAAGLTYMPRIFIIEADYLNAFASGYSQKSALIAVTRGLLTKLQRSELQAVIAHELSHIRHHDMKLTLCATVLANIMLIVLDMLVVSSNHKRRRHDNLLVVLIMVLRWVLPLLNVLLLLYLSRTREYMADAGAVELMRDNVPLGQALLKIAAAPQGSFAHENIRAAAYIFNGTRQALFATHPTLEARLQAIGFLF